MVLMTYGLLKSLHEDSSAVAEPPADSRAPDGTSLARDLHA